MTRIAAAILLTLLAGCGWAATGGAGAVTDPSGAWVLERGTGPGGEVVVPDAARFTLTFEGNQVGGQACNHYGGEYRLAGGAISLSAMSATEMACAPDVMAAEAAYHAALAAVTRIERDGETLTLRGEATELVFRLLPPVPDAALRGTRWTLDTLIRGDAATTVGGDAWLRLGADGRLAGSTGCRALRGAFVVSGDQIVPTDLAAEGECDAELAEQDALVVEVLESGAIVQVEGGRLTLSEPNGNGLSYVAAE